MRLGRYILHASGFMGTHMDSRGTHGIRGYKWNPWGHIESMGRVRHGMGHMMGGDEVGEMPCVGGRGGVGVTNYIGPNLLS